MLPSLPKKILVSGGIGLLCLVAFLAGGIFLNSASASSHTVQSGTMIKGGFRVLHVQGQDIQAVVLHTNSGVLKVGSAVMIHTTASTAYQRDGIAVRSVTLTGGSQIAAGGTVNSDGSITALIIAIGNMGQPGHKTCGDLHTSTFSGVVTGIQGNTLTIVDGMNGYRFNPSCGSFEQGSALRLTVQTDAQTQFVQGTSSISSLSEITVGTTIQVEGTQASNGTITADRVTIEQPYAIGQIVRISGSTITLEGNLMVHVDASTVVQNKAQPYGFGFSDLKVGDTIYAVGNQNSDGSLNATTIFYLGPFPQTSANGGK